MRSRPEHLIALLLAAMAVGVPSGSALLGLRAADRVSTADPAGTIPQVLLSPESAVSVAPVRPDISAELADAHDDSVGLDAIAPTPVARSSPAPTARGTKPPETAAPVVPQVLLTLSFRETRTHNRTSVSYTATVRNTGATPLQGLVVTAHVPAGTFWVGSKACRGGRPLEISYDSGPPEVVCTPVARLGVADDPASHPVVARFTRPLPPNGEAAATYTVEVARGTTRIVNHVHVDGAGIHGDSPPVVAEVA